MKIYNTRYAARKEKSYGDKVVKVCGGYVLMSEFDYRVWKNQK